MTREEAIETLKANYPDACYEQLREAVDTAIEALKAQGAAGDTISRQAAIDEIEYELEMINSALDSITLDFNARERLRQRRGEAREILNSIQQLPPAEPEPSDVARAIATIIENEQDMRVILKNAQNDIVHCRNCKFCHKSLDWKHLQSFGMSIWRCGKCRGLNAAETVNLDDYCSSAERRTDESD